MIRNLGLIGHRAGPDRGGPRNNVVAGRTTVRISGMVLMSPRDNGPAHIGVIRRTSNAGIHATMGDNGTVWWRKEPLEISELGSGCLSRIMGNLRRGCGCGGMVRVPGIAGIIVGVTINRTIAGSGTLSTTIGSVAVVSNRGPVVAGTGGSVTTFGVHRNVGLNYGIALHNRQVCRFLSGLVGLALPHIHSFRNIDTANFSNHNGCALNLGRRLVFPRVRCSGISGTHNVSVAVIAATAASRRNHSVLGVVNVPFRGW